MTYVPKKKKKGGKEWEGRNYGMSMSVMFITTEQRESIPSRTEMVYFIWTIHRIFPLFIYSYNYLFLKWKEKNINHTLNTKNLSIKLSTSWKIKTKQMPLDKWIKREEYLP